jgi:hypothetical protein
MEDCIVYLVFQLRQSGFEVKFTWPDLLWISWKHTEGEYLTRQNPIIQAMVPEKPKPLPNPKQTSQKRGKQAIALPQMPTGPVNPFNEDIHLINNSAPPSSFGSTPLTATPKNASDYKPPDSFLQNLERPGPDRQQNNITGQPQKSKSTGERGNILEDLWKF